MKIIDLRSDTVTRPTDQMRKAMADAEVGDDVYRDDPTVKRLESYAAELLGFERSLFTASGTQANLISVMSHCGRGDEYIVGQLAHSYKYEGGGAAVLGSIQPQPIEFEADSTLDLQKIEEKIKPDDIHFARTRLLCLENTHNGKALPLNYLPKVAQFGQKKNLKLHLDGARIFNAVIKQGVSVQDIAGNFDSISVCLSKGLGAPVGSLLFGSRDFIEEARRWRKMTGGGMRQAGILAAAGLYALQKNVERLAVDHENAEILTRGLSKFEQLTTETSEAQTNMVFFGMEPSAAIELGAFLKGRNILISAEPTTRLVTHLDINREDVQYTLDKFGEFFKSRTA